jgi:ABC-type transport system involved in cytochrome c biogenesis permease subunit
MIRSFAVVTGLHWAAVLCYVAATVLAVYGSFFDRPRAVGRAVGVALPGILLHAAGLALWWRIVGHGPYVGRFEVLSAYAWVLVVGFVAFARLYPRIQVVSLFVYPATFVMVALGLFLQPEIKQLPPTFRGIWLVLHITFYKIAFSAILIALAFSIFFLLKSRGRLKRFSSLPEPATLDLYAYRFTGFGFLFWAIGMLAGSIWAYQSWNIFWNWDPVQVWSLIAWSLFGVYLHLRRFFGWRGARAAWLLTACFLVVVVSLFFTPIIESSIHAGYFK